MLDRPPNLSAERVRAALEDGAACPLHLKSIDDLVRTTQRMLGKLLLDAKLPQIPSPGTSITVEDCAELCVQNLLDMVDLVKYRRQLFYHPKWAHGGYHLLPSGHDRKLIAAQKAFGQYFLTFVDSDTGKAKPWIPNLKGPLARLLWTCAREVRYLGPPAWFDGALHLASSNDVDVTGLAIARVGLRLAGEPGLAPCGDLLRLPVPDR